MSAYVIHLMIAENREAPTATGYSYIAVEFQSRTPSGAAQFLSLRTYPDNGAGMQQQNAEPMFPVLL
jgi:hypothetical protein